MKGLYFEPDIKKIVMVKALSAFWKNAPLSFLSPVTYGEVETTDYYWMEAPLRSSAPLRITGKPVSRLTRP